MKRLASIFLCLLWGVEAIALPLSQSAREEADVFNTFLEAAYAQRRVRTDRFSKLRKALQKAPDSAYIKQQLVAEALTVNVPELADPYADFIEDASQDPEAWAVYAVYQWRKGARDKAIEAYEKALALDPDDELVLFQYITVLAETQPDKAAQTLEELAAARPLFATDIYTEMGNMYAYHHNFPAALAAFNKAQKANARDPRPRLGRVSVYEKTSQYFLMLHELEELEKMGFSNAQTWAQMGAVYVIVRDFQRAEECFLKAKQADNGSLPAGNFLALLSEQRGDYAKAISYLQDTADYQESAEKQIQVSYYQRKQGQDEQSLRTLEQVHKNFPDNDHATYLYAVALHEAQQYKKAQRLLARLVEKYPDQADIRLQYAFTLESLKKYKKMEQQINILLEQDPRNAAALNLMAFSLAERGERLEQAASYSARALAVWPEDSSLIDTQAWILYKQGKYQQAADLLRALPTQFIEDNPEISYHLGMVEYALGNTQRALEYLNQAAQGGWKPAQQALKKLK